MRMAKNIDSRPWINSYDKELDADLLISDVTYVDLLEKSMNENPDRPVLHYMGRTLTFRDLDDLSSKFASYLQKNEIGQGHVVGIDLPNIPEYLIALSGALRAGCAVTGISPLLSPGEMEHQINDSNAKALVIMDVLFEKKLYKIKDKIPRLKIIITAGVGDSISPVKSFLGSLFGKIPKGKILPIL